MKTYTITVNGNVYDVTVEEGTSAAAPVAAPKVAPRPVAPAPAAATPVPAPAPAPAAPAKPAASGTAGSIRVEAGAAGKVFGIDAAVGQAVKAGDPVVTIEAMKMEIPVVAPQDGTVASIDVAVGDAVEAGALLATLN
ncbi:MAG: acetyl-CoA carboxylase biotin carboxyl carrier protein subunit [Clostridiales bacterium]|nr:MAG: acetyl-CoA carboxylase biotin carboxyl carrier protein subunit [Clostridiales bacterium]